VRLTTLSSRSSQFNIVASALEASIRNGTTTLYILVDDVPPEEYSEHQTSRVTIQCILVRLPLTALIDKMQIESLAMSTFLRDIEKVGRNNTILTGI
jgi:hypothetical protein